MPDKLAGLRGLHLPAAMQPDTRAMLVAAALGIGAAMLLRLVFAARRRTATWPAAKAWAVAESLPPAERLVAQAALLRQVVTTREQGEAWLARLDAVFRTRFFSAGPGRAFGPALYRPQADPPGPRDAGLRALLRRAR